ncbi:MAG: D-cysteine desulfhydrase family protein [Anaerolineales bacterium]
MFPPRLSFAHLPTPIEALPRLSRALGGPQIFVKRDDQTGLAFGGNKTRKLEFLLAEAQALGADHLVTAGAVQSNHCRQTAAAAARFGLRCTLVLFGDPPPKPEANLWLDHIFGANIRWTDRSRRDAMLEQVFNELKERGEKPYLVPYGGSSPTGAFGYVFAMQEFLEQGMEFDAIVFASSSGGTQAGLVLGARLFGYRGRVIGISVDEPRPTLQRRVAALVEQMAERLGQNIVIRPEEIEVEDAWAAAGYGVLTEAEKEAIRLFARQEGLLLDPVYTGRAAAGLIGLIRRGDFAPHQRVLFWHTGGTPALFASRYASILE